MIYEFIVKKRKFLKNLNNFKIIFWYFWNHFVRHFNIFFFLCIFKDFCVIKFRALIYIYNILYGYILYSLIIFILFIKFILSVHHFLFVFL